MGQSSGTDLNILVTGGAGYVGSHACKALAAKGYVPITYDNLSRGNGWAVKWGPLEKGEISDQKRPHGTRNISTARANAFCRLRLCGRICRTAIAVLRKQFRRNCSTAANLSRL